MRYFNQYDARERDNPGAVDCSGPSRTKQEFKEECDINNVMARYVFTGTAPVTLKTARYEDFSDAPDYQTALDILRTAGQQFSYLPSRVRARFDNDPMKFLDFVHDKANLKECAELGLLTEEAARAALTPPAVPPKS